MVTTGGNMLPAALNIGKYTISYCSPQLPCRVQLGKPTRSNKQAGSAFDIREKKLAWYLQPKRSARVEFCFDIV